ncbi:hypothetical protein V520_11060 [Pseudomonas putida KG-4]|nr:hypothetical protein V520_11060 [Pseudomonas putida KG-4]
MLKFVQYLDYSFSPWIARYQVSECPECLPPCNLKKMEIAISSTAVKRFLDISAHKSSDSFPLCTLSAPLSGTAVVNQAAHLRWGHGPLGFHLRACALRLPKMCSSNC